MTLMMMFSKTAIDKTMTVSDGKSFSFIVKPSCSCLMDSSPSSKQVFLPKSAQKLAIPQVVKMQNLKEKPVLYFMVQTSQSKTLYHQLSSFQKLQSAISKAYKGKKFETKLPSQSSVSKAITDAELRESIRCTLEKFLKEAYEIIDNESFLPCEAFFDSQQQPVFVHLLDPQYKKGYIKKQGHKRKNWKTRWFVLAGKYLHYFHSKDSDEPIFSINLSLGTVTPVDSPKYEHCFRLTAPMDEKKAYLFQCESDASRDDWISSLEHTFHLLASKST